MAALAIDPYQQNQIGLLDSSTDTMYYLNFVTATLIGF